MEEGQLIPRRMQNHVTQIRNRHKSNAEQGYKYLGEALFRTINRFFHRFHLFPLGVVFVFKINNPSKAAAIFARMAVHDH